MAILITAPLGTGKTLYTIKLIFEYLNQGRPVYSNIVGLKIPGVINVESTSQSPFDWRDLPNDAVLVYDEAHEHPAYSERDLLKNLTIEEYEKRLKEAENLDLPDTKKKSLISTIEREYSKALKRKKEQILDIGLSMSMHRHFGQEILLITQNPTKLNKDVLGNVTIHYVMRRKFGFEAANIWTFGEAMTTWGKSVADSALEKKYWRFPKHLYKFYVSSEKHNMKKYFPKKYYAFACIPLLIFYLAYSKASDTGFFGLIPKHQQDSELSYNVVKPVEGKTKQELHDEIQAQKMGLTLDQYKDLKNPQANNDQNLELTQNSLNQITASYKASDPFDYSYMQSPPVTAYQVFSGCFNGVAYDTQGTILHDAPKDLCQRVMAGDRPFNPYRNSNNAMVTQNSITQDYSQAAEQNVQQIQLTPDELAKFQQAKMEGLI